MQLLSPHNSNEPDGAMPAKSRAEQIAAARARVKETQLGVNNARDGAARFMAGVERRAAEVFDIRDFVAGSANDVIDRDDHNSDMVA